MSETTKNSTVSYIDESLARGSKNVVLRRNTEHPGLEEGGQPKPESEGVKIAKAALNAYSISKKVEETPVDENGGSKFLVSPQSQNSKLNCRPSMMSGGARFFSDNFVSKVGSSLLKSH
ncbi:MAG: hypothetical protein U1F57_11555 [bacterium]